MIHVPELYLPVLHFVERLVCQFSQKLTVVVMLSSFLPAALGTVTSGGLLGQWNTNKSFCRPTSYQEQKSFRDHGETQKTWIWKNTDITNNTS